MTREYFVRAMDWNKVTVGLIQQIEVQADLRCRSWKLGE
jgi:hypothetical protein